MLQEFFINRKATLPYLTMEIVDDGRNDYERNETFNNAVQNADITFTMYNSDTGKLAISNAPAEKVILNKGTCNEKYGLQYQWKKMDTLDKGHYTGVFKIKFKDDLYESGKSYPRGVLYVPIQEDLDIFIK